MGTPPPPIYWSGEGGGGAGRRWEYNTSTIWHPLTELALGDPFIKLIHSQCPHPVVLSHIGTANTYQIACSRGSIL